MLRAVKIINPYLKITLFKFQNNTMLIIVLKYKKKNMKNMNMYPLNVVLMSKNAKH